MRPVAGRASLGAMVAAAGVRITWDDLPGSVTRAVEEIIGGGAVVEAVSQPGGFSPGSADRVRTADGRRAFVKAVSTAQNEHSPGLHRREARITASLPPAAPTPALLGVHDDGEWVALVLTDVDGRHPDWSDPADVAAARAAVGELARVLTPCPIGVPVLCEQVASDFAGWRRLRDDPPPRLDPWVAEHIDELCDLAERGRVALAGNTLTHCDLRADNLLISEDGTVTVVDWPWGARGPAWFDTVLLLLNIRLYGGRADLTMADAPRQDAVAVLAGFGGYFANVARLPAPVGLPTVRAFQQAQADTVIAWLRELDDDR